jgi:hypothetical protein
MIFDSLRLLERVGYIHVCARLCQVVRIPNVRPRPGWIRDNLPVFTLIMMTLVITAYKSVIIVPRFADSPGILYTWYKAVQGGMYWYEPVRTLLDTRPYEKPQNGTYHTYRHR